jgi:hypothetical protein
MWKDQLTDDLTAQSRSKTSAHYAKIAESILTARMRFGRAFGFDLATDPNSDMLLFLYVREHEGRSTSLSALWGASNVAYSTARRCVTAIEERGIVRRVPDPTDGRRYLVCLTPTALQLIESGLELVREAGSQPQPENDTEP